MEPRSRSLWPRIDEHEFWSFRENLLRQHEIGAVNRLRVGLDQPFDGLNVPCVSLACVIESSTGQRKIDYDDSGYRFLAACV